MRPLAPAATGYRQDYVKLDRQRRGEFAQAGLWLATQLQTQLIVTAGAITSAQADFDAAVRDLYYDAVAESGLEHALATLAKTYDTHYAAVVSGQWSVVSSQNTSEAWHPWAALAAAEAQADLDERVVPLADRVFENRLALAASDNAYNEKLGLQGRARSLRLPIFSPRLREALDQASIGVNDIQYLPIRLFQSTGDEVHGFHIANVISRVAALDREASTILSDPNDVKEIDPLTGKPAVHGLWKAALLADPLVGHDIVRLLESFPDVYVSERFADVFRKGRNRIIARDSHGIGLIEVAQFLISV